MKPKKILALIAGGESSKVQFKENVNNTTSIAQEMVAFSNAKGGKIIIGVNDKTGEVTGLDFPNIQRINNLLATAANEHVKSAIFIETETVEVEPEKRVVIVSVPEGYDKPYMDKNGLIFMKNGSDKRKVTSKEEIARMLQSSGNLYAEELPLHHCDYKDIDWAKFQTFYESRYLTPFVDKDRERLFENLRLGEGGKPNVAGALLFTNKPEKTITGFFITAIWFWGNRLEDTTYRASENIRGTLPQQYEGARNFVLKALNRVQAGQSFNSVGKLEVPELVFEELITNALIHRDYFIKDMIKLLIFEDRIEIKSPGKLPNNLTTEQIKKGIRKKRNNIIDSLAPELLHYRGVGSGILRALTAYPAIDFLNDPETEQFTAIITRPKMERAPSPND